MTATTMRWELCGSIFVIVHNEKPPSADEYAATLNGYAKHLGRFRGILIHSDGGAPDASQRKATTEFWAGKKLPKTAILTSSGFARGVITALNWFFPQELRALRAGDFAGAFEYLDAPLSDRATVQDTVARLRNELRAGSGSAARA